MKERLPEVIKAKGEGTIGEGVDGLLHAVGRRCIGRFEENGR